MNHYIVAVKDRAIDAFMRPFTVPHTNAAVRSFQDEINNPQSELAKHTEDYDLWLLGTFDDQTGTVVGHETPRVLARAQDLKNI